MFLKKEDIQSLQEIVKNNEKKYGIAQVKDNFSPKSNLLSDQKALRGMQVLREKIYPKI